MALSPISSPVPVSASNATVGVVHVLDALNIGGAERVAVNLVNLLPRERYVPYLCTTRSEGPLTRLVAPDVTRLRLERRGTFDAGALRQFVRFIAHRQIAIVHAHGSALFFSRLASALAGRCALVWHDHYGGADFADRSAWLYRLATRRISGVIAVNEALGGWCRERLGLPAERVWYIPNLAPPVDAEPLAAPLDLPGQPGKRLVCVANFRPQKDHPTLLLAMARVHREAPGAHLFLAGDSADPAYVAAIRVRISALGLDRAVTYLGPRNDVPAILSACSIGVLSSASEGLPLALLEYGRHGLAAIATTVGQCPEVLDNGACGVLVPPGSPEDLSQAMLDLLTNPGRRARLGARFQNRVEEYYGARRILRQICDVYETILKEVVS